MKTFAEMTPTSQQLIDLAIRARVNAQVAHDNRMYALANEHRGEEHGLLTAVALVDGITFAQAYAACTERIIASGRNWLLEDAA